MKIYDDNFFESCCFNDSTRFWIDQIRENLKIAINTDSQKEIDISLYECIGICDQLLDSRGDN